MSDASRAAQEFTRLVEIVAALRAPDGCPWDREQTIDSLKPFVLEETYEVLEAIDRHDHAALSTSLGAAPWDTGKPSVLIAHTTKGKGVSFMEDKVEWHYRSPNAAQLADALTELAVAQ